MASGTVETIIDGKGTHTSVQTGRKTDRVIDVCLTGARVGYASRRMGAWMDTDVAYLGNRSYRCLEEGRWRDGRIPTYIDG